MQVPSTAAASNLQLPVTVDVISPLVLDPVSANARAAGRNGRPARPLREPLSRSRTVEGRRAQVDQNGDGTSGW